MLISIFIFHTKKKIIILISIFLISWRIKNFSSLLVPNILVLSKISQNVNKLLAPEQDEILLYTKLEGEDKFRVTSTTKLKGHRQDSISLRVARLEGKHCSSVNRVVITATERKPVSSSPGTSDDERSL